MPEEFKKVIGTPTMMLLPARNYTFKVFEQEHSIIIPRKGTYKDFDDKVFSEKDGDFEVMPYVEEEQANVLYLPALSKILFATGKYPRLLDDQAFIPYAMVIREDEVEVVGSIIQMLKEDK